MNEKSTINYRTLTVVRNATHQQIDHIDYRTRDLPYSGRHEVRGGTLPSVRAGAAGEAGGARGRPLQGTLRYTVAGDTVD